MKYLYLIRHAKASSDYLRIPDFDRPLKAIGVMQAHQVSSKLSDKGVKPDAILSSPASRALQTAQIFAAKNKINFANIIFDQEIYEASMEKLVQSISRVDDQYNHLFFVGHNPGLLELANYLLDSYMQKMPVCAVICIKIDSDTWKSLRQNKNQLEFFDFAAAIENKIETPTPEENKPINDGAEI